MLVIADSLDDGIHAVIFPVKTIHVCYRSKVGFGTDKDRYVRENPPPAEHLMRRVFMP